MSALDDAKFGMMMGMLRKVYTPAAAAEFATWLRGKSADDQAFIRECLLDLTAAIDAPAAEPTGAPRLTLAR